MKGLVRSALISTIFLNSTLSFASALSDFQIDAFMSAGVSSTDVVYLPSGIEPIYAMSIEKHPSFDKDTNVGIQLTKKIVDDVSFTTQFYAEGSTHYDVEATWAFLKWEPGDTFQFRGGRVRANTYMLSDHIHVAYTYPWVRPPQEVYLQVPIKNFTGADARFKYELFGRDLTLSAFWGSATQEISFPAIPNGSIYDDFEMRVRDLYSFEVKYGSDIFSVRAAFQTGDTSLSPDMSTFMRELNNFLNTLVGMGALGTDYVNYFNMNHNSMSFSALGYRFDWKNVVSMAEIVKRHSSSPVVTNCIGWYVMGGYRIKDIMPHVTFGRIRLQDNFTRRFPWSVNAAFTSPPVNFPVPLDVVAQSLIGPSTHFEGGVGDQSSVTLGLRWDVLEGVAVKGEYQHVHIDRNSTGLFDFAPHKSVNVYSFAINAVV